MKSSKMPRLIFALFAFMFGLAVHAMPTRAELAQAQPIVNDLTADDLRALKSKEKKPGDVAAAHLALADKADTEAGKYLLLQGAFRLYARSGDYDAAAATLQRMRGEIAGLPPELIVEIVNNEMRRVAATKAPRVLAIFRDAQRMIKYRKQLAAAELDATAHPENVRYQRRVAECHACLGDWPKALEIFAKIGAEAAKFERDPASAAGCDAAKAADFWWNYKAADVEPFKAHAAALYKKGLEDGTITGLRKSLAEKRVKEMEGVMTDAPAVANAPAASGKAPSNALYCVIDLSAGPTASKYPVKWLAKPPTGGFNTDEYKTNKLVLRRIEPGKFKMGGKYEVTLTKPYYIGIFEMTQKQYNQVTGSNHSKFNDDGRRPVERVSWNMIRGDSTTYNWPTSVNVDPSSFMGKMQTCTGLNFDLPTEAQWEYACRAGSDGEFGGTGRIDDMGWYKNNSGGRTHPVGQKQANAWGIHDMHGNVGEWCLDWKGNLLGGETDPVGSSSGSKRIWRGSCWCECDPNNCGSSARGYSATPSFSDSTHFGFRLCMNPESSVGVSAQGGGTPAASKEEAAERHPAKVGAPTTGSWAISANVRAPLVRTLKLPGNVDMDFCVIPAGTFEMSNVPEQEPRYHKVTITRPFWISRQFVTSQQNRAVGGTPVNDGLAQKLEKMFPEDDIVFRVKGRTVDVFINAMNERFGAGLPRGYVFRLPTEAELEYAVGAGGKYKNDTIYWNHTRKALLSKGLLSEEEKNAKGVPKEYERVLIFERFPVNPWKLIGGWTNAAQLTLDHVDVPKDVEWKGNPKENLVYAKKEVDPLRSGNRWLKRQWNIGRWLTTGRNDDIFRVVIAPDLVAEKKAGKK